MVYCNSVAAGRSPDCIGRSFAVHIANNPLHIAVAVDCNIDCIAVIVRSPLAADIAGLVGRMQLRAEKCSLAG